MVEKHGNKWRYDFLKDGTRYRAGGFRSKAEAIEAEARARAGAKSINTDLLKLMNSRLEDIQIRRTKLHFWENNKLFKELMQRWGNLPKITTDDVEKYLNEIAKKSKPMANKYLRLVSIRKPPFSSKPPVYCQGGRSAVR